MFLQMYDRMHQDKDCWRLIESGLQQHPAFHKVQQNK